MTFHVDSALISRLDAAGYAYWQGRMNVASRLRQDPSSVVYLEWENIRALLAPGIANPAFNTVTISGPTRLGDVQNALDAYRQRELTPSLSLSPGASSPELGALLSEHGFRQTALQPIFVNPTAEPKPEARTNIEVVAVETPTQLEAFQSLYVRGWRTDPGFAPTLRSLIALWPEVPGWKMYLALERGEPIAVAKLSEHGAVHYLADAATAPEFCRRGAQSALIRARLKHARASGAELVFTTAEFGSSSHRNMEREGLALRYARAVWTKG